MNAEDSRIADDSLSSYSADTNIQAHQYLSRKADTPKQANTETDLGLNQLGRFRKCMIHRVIFEQQTSKLGRRIYEWVVTYDEAYIFIQTWW